MFRHGPLTQPPGSIHLSFADVPFVCLDGLRFASHLFGMHDRDHRIHPAVRRRDQTDLQTTRQHLCGGASDLCSALRVPFWWPMRWINPLRLCISGAAALPTPVHEKFEKKFGVPLMEGYGLTEASPVVALNPEKKASGRLHWKAVAWN